MDDDADSANDEQLASRCRTGDRDAFAVLVNRHWESLYRWLYSLTKSTHAAEDLAQDAFFKAWKSMPSYESGPGFRAWIFRIARNSWIDQARQLGRHRTEPVLEDLEAIQEQPFAATLRQEQSDILQQAVNQLPEIYREALQLRIAENLTFSEIGLALDLNEDTVRWRVFRARQLLLAELRHLSGEDHGK